MAIGKQAPIRQAKMLVVTNSIQALETSFSGALDRLLAKGGIEPFAEGAQSGGPCGDIRMGRCRADLGPVTSHRLRPA